MKLKELNEANDIKKLKAKFLEWYNDKINDIDYTDMDDFAESNNLSDEEIRILQSMNLKVVEK